MKDHDEEFKENKPWGQNFPENFLKEGQTRVKPGSMSSPLKLLMRRKLVKKETSPSKENPFGQL
jgi:hypothetical protein